MKNWLFYGKISILALTLSLSQAASCGQQETPKSAGTQGSANAVSPASNETTVQGEGAKAAGQSVKVTPQGGAPNQHTVDSLKNLSDDKKH